MPWITEICPHLDGPSRLGNRQDETLYNTAGTCGEVSVTLAIGERLQSMTDVCVDGGAGVNLCAGVRR